MRSKSPFTLLSMLSCAMAVGFLLLAEDWLRNGLDQADTLLRRLMLLTDLLPQNTPQPMGWTPLSWYSVNEIRLFGLFTWLAALLALLGFISAIVARKRLEPSACYPAAGALAFVLGVLAVRLLLISSVLRGGY